MAYEIFLEKCPTEQDKIGSIMSVVAPDPKIPVLLAMKLGKLYTRLRLFEEVLYYCGINTEDFPVAKQTIWAYCDGSGKYEGSFSSIGCVVERKYEKKFGEWVTAYEITDFGEDFGKKICKLAIGTINELWKKRSEYGNYCSMWKIIGQCSKPEDAKYRRGYSLVKVIEHLIKNPGSHTRKDIQENLKEYGIDDTVISSILNSLGKGRIIDYKSPHRDEKGKRARGWSKYYVKEYITPEDRPKYSNGNFIVSWKRWNEISEYLNEKIGEEVSCVELEEKFKLSPTNASRILTYLEKRGKLENLGIKGKEKQSEARANEITEIFYYNFLEPAMEAVINLDPEIEEFRKCEEYYQKNPDIYREHLQNVLYIYDIERTHIGKKGGKEIRKAILDVLSKNKGPMKLSHIYQEVLKRINRDIKWCAIRNQLKNLIKEGKIIRQNKGYYKIAGE